MSKTRKLVLTIVTCDNKSCKAEITTAKTKGRVQCFRCGKRTDI